MTDHIVAFDGTPVQGGAGARVAIIERGETKILETTDKRNVSRDEFSRLLDRGLITKIEPSLPISTFKEVLVYRTCNRLAPFAEVGEVRWTACDTTEGSFEVAYLSYEGARQVLSEYAASMHADASRALQKNERESAVELARRGLMAVPGMRKSELAAKLYAVLIAATDDVHRPLLKREAQAMLSPDSYRAMEGRLDTPRVGSRSPRVRGDRDMWLLVGSAEPPRGTGSLQGVY